MKNVLISFFTAILFLSLNTSDVLSQPNLAQQWKQGLGGVKLTNYSGSAISSNSTLTVLELCRNGRYRYYKEGSWSVPGQAGGASQNTVSGYWSIEAQNGNAYITYQTDRGEKGYFPIYLLNNGKVSIGGAAFSAQQNAARCY